MIVGEPITLCTVGYNITCWIELIENCIQKKTFRYQCADMFMKFLETRVISRQIMQKNHGDFMKKSTVQSQVCVTIPCTCTDDTYCLLSGAGRVKISLSHQCWYAFLFFVFRVIELLLNLCHLNQLITGKVLTQYICIIIIIIIVIIIRGIVAPIQPVNTTPTIAQQQQKIKETILKSMQVRDEGLATTIYG